MNDIDKKLPTDLLQQYFHLFFAKLAPISMQKIHSGAGNIKLFTGGSAAE